MYSSCIDKTKDYPLVVLLFGLFKSSTTFMGYNGVRDVFCYQRRNMMSIQTINPTSGEVLETFEPFNREQINEALDDVRQGFLFWRTNTFAERSKHLHSVASHLRERKKALARIAVLKWAKPLQKPRQRLKNVPGTAIFTLTMPGASSQMKKLPPMLQKAMSPSV